MKLKFWKRSSIDVEIDRVILEMSKIDPDTQEYVRASNSLKNLYEARSYKGPSSIGLENVFDNTMAFVRLVFVLKHEEGHPISSKAFNWLRGGKKD